MLKRLLIAAAILAGLVTPVHVANGAGTVPGISMTQQLDSLGKPLNGGRLYLIQAGTTSTPQNCYQDSGLTIPWPNPITLDSAGRIPQLFCADGQIKIRLTNAAGVQQLVADNLLVVGPSGGGGGGGSVDPTTVLSTGDFKLVYNTGPITGFVRCNGRTIGSATSGATERANADTSALFSFLWGADPNLAVSGGRGASAAADYAANKTIALPDCRGRGVAGLDDMGNSAAGRLTTSYFGAGPTTLGSSGNSNESNTLTVGQLPTGITSTASPSLFVSTTSSYYVAANPGNNLLVSAGGSGGVGAVAISGALVGLLPSSGTATGTVSSTSNNTLGQPHRTVQPTILATIYIKL